MSKAEMQRNEEPYRVRLSEKHPIIHVARRGAGRTACGRVLGEHAVATPTHPADDEPWRVCEQCWPHLEAAGLLLAGDR